jgi:hypothetical protein
MDEADNSVGGDAMERDDAERKIWLDYLGKLNDRELHRKTLGPTDWGLIGVAAVILYRCIPQAPAFFRLNSNKAAVHPFGLVT